VPPGPLRVHRLVSGRTQAELASEAGLSREQVVRLERGTCSPSLRTALALADALGCELVEIFPSDSKTPASTGASPKPGDTDARHDEL
jgi:DNA-binding XRE family transcriptional regulator